MRDKTSERIMKDVEISLLAMIEEFTMLSGKYKRKTIDAELMMDAVKWFCNKNDVLWTEFLEKNKKN